MVKIMRTLLNRMGITVLLIILQLAFIIFEIFKLGNYYIQISIALNAISVMVAFWIVCQEEIRPEIKIAWIVPILLFPLFGGIMYILYGHNHVSKKLKTELQDILHSSRKLLEQNQKEVTELSQDEFKLCGEVKYLYRAGYPLYKNSSATYYEIGEKYWEALLIELEKAEEFIFLEYFIINQGKVWDSVHEILKRKVKEGVEVRLLYDDMGSVFYLPFNFAARLEKEGIRCLAFNKLFPMMSISQNNRDHRKIVVIDGKTAFTGGINLADEYINHTHLYGHWKDTGIKLHGEGVWSFTVMFLQMWCMSGRTKEDFNRYRTEETGKEENFDGYIQPYGDIPYLKERVGEKVYLNIIESARKYLYIYTPYLIIGNDMTKSLIRAADRGVDVRIVTPGVPDKKMVYWLTQSNYKVLVEGGIKILQYTPGFLHGKCVLCDDYKAVVGTVNFDYRSFIHHFECGAVLYNASICKDMKEDILSTFTKCEEITMDWFGRKHIRWWLFGPVLKLLSPLF
jgi:cardiolipin synthase